jgi:hypothetical protein
MNVKDPYVSIVGTMREEGSVYNPPSIDIATVISSDPLTITIPGMQIDKDKILVSDFLLEGYIRKITIPSTSATGSTSDGSISSINIPDGELNLINGLKKGDKVACLSTSNGQTYIILCKVVKP